MPLRASLIDVAREAGVSPATVDRVLNGRAGVRARTAERVSEAAHRLGYRPDPAAARLARARVARLGFVLPAGTNTFVGMLAEQIGALGAWLAEQRARAEVQTVDVFSPAALAQHLAGLHGRFDAVVVMALDHPLVRAAIDDLAAAGTTVVTLVSDVPGSRRLRYVGIDNVAAGRTAGTLLGRFVGARDGSVGVVLGGHALRDHAERLLGFRQVLGSEYPTLKVLDPIEGQDRSDRTEPLVARLLRREGALVGLYSIGAGNRGIQAALEASGRAREITWICHELTPHARRALLDGTADAVINQDAGHEVRSACRVALAAIHGERVIADQERIRIDIFVKDNLP
ncbi:LacI family DNA-binding transcriptional regulator [Piscinibacter sp.]|jgi:LacI family transcriptional regulator|uniref:LacI family DNA-binding transcriptional regulator n=1 Tax=Piscinibacter sp. TaxID=1903157 RepID=UPI0035599AA0